MFGWNGKKPGDAGREADLGGVTEGLLITGQSGFVSGTRLATEQGWRAVEELGVGDRVLTFDHGMQTVVDIQRETVHPPEDVFSATQRPVVVPAGAMNNHKDLWLMPDQGMLVETDVTTDAVGDPFAVVPARSLKGLRGIRSIASTDPLAVTTLAFANDEVIYVDGGMLAYCPRPLSILTDPPRSGVDLYNVLDMRAARYLVECLIDDDNGGALLCDPDEIASVAARNGRRERPVPVLT